LSRFDAIFIVRDVREDRVDKAIASHVLNLHMHAQRAEAGNADISSSSEEISLELMRKYVCYSKMKVRPTLSEEAQHML